MNNLDMDWIKEIDWIKIVEGAMILIGLGVIVYTVYQKEKADKEKIEATRKEIRKEREKI